MSERPKLKDIANELYEVKTQWNDIGIQLEVPKATRKRLQQVHKDNPQQALTEMMEEWLDTDDPEPSWPAIVKALRSRSVNAKTLANNLERRWCPDQYRDDRPPSPSESLLDAASTPFGLQMMPGHTYQEVSADVRTAIKRLSKSLNKLRCETCTHIESLQITPTSFRSFVCKPDLCLEKEDRYLIFTTDSVTDIFTIISSERKYLNWQKYDFLEEVIEEYGNPDLKSKFDEYSQEVKSVENETELEDLKNIIFTPLGADSFLMKVPIPNGITQPKMSLMRDATNGFRRNGYRHVSPHHVGHNSPLSIFFVIPRQLIPPASMAKLKLHNAKNIEDRVVYTLSEEEALWLMNIRRSPTHPDKVVPPMLPASHDDSAAPATPQSLNFFSLLHLSRDIQIFHDKVLAKGDNAVTILLMDHNLKEFLKRAEGAPPLHTQLNSFSFGVLAVHIVTSETPSPCSLALQSSQSSEIERYKRSFKKIKSTDPLNVIIIHCLNDEAKKRPSAAKLCRDLSDMKTSPEYCNSQEAERVTTTLMGLQINFKQLCLLFSQQ